MHFRTIASVALLACASHVAAEAAKKPYKLAMMPISGLSLMRRDTNGYIPEQTHCGSGSTCAEACGNGYATCPSHDDNNHCFNPGAQQSCCSDGTGNSCDKGYYCTQDTGLQTWCCPDEMNLAACAAAYGVTGGLKTPVATTSTPTPTPSSTKITTSSTSSTPKSTSTSFTPVTTSASSTPRATGTKTEVVEETVACASSSGHTTAWTGSNSTISTAVPKQPSESYTIPVGTSPTTLPPQATGAASAKSVSALLMAAAGVVALL